MLEFQESGPYRPEQIIRYAVRCDRERAQAIERAAHKAGVSVAGFVQAHFDRILDAADKPVAAPAAPDTLALDGEMLAAGPGRFRPADRERASELGISLTALRLLRVASAIARDDGSFEGDQNLLGTATSSAPPGIIRLLRQLEMIGAVMRLQQSSGPRKSVWRVLKPEPV